MQSISFEQNISAVESAVEQINERFELVGIKCEIRKHKAGRKFSFVHIDCPPNHWVSLAKWLKFEQNVDYLSMITGIHFPLEFEFFSGKPGYKPGTPEKGWEVIVHLTRKGIRNPNVGEQIITNAAKLTGMGIPLEYQVSIVLPQTDEPSVPSVQTIWEGADWNEKETWDLVGIAFEGHENMMRVLNPHDSPEGFHPLQKQHKIRYHDHNEMYDDAQGFMRKPLDSDKKK